MGKDNLRDLKILDEIGNGKEITQRGLSEELGIALGLTNSCLKRLIKKGFVKITGVKKNRIRYLLTPSGIAEQARLTYHYLQYTMDFYKQARSKIKHDFQELSQKGLKKVIFYGAGEVAEISFLSLQESDLQLIGVIDDYKEGKNFFGFPILDCSKICQFDFDIIVITSFTAMEAIHQKLKDIGMNEDRICKIGER